MEEEEERTNNEERNVAAGRQKSRSRGAESKQQEQGEATRKQIKMPFDADSCEMEEEFNEQQGSPVAAVQSESQVVSTAGSCSKNEQRSEISKGLVSKTVKKGTGRNNHGSGLKYANNNNDEESQSEDEEAEGEGEGEDLNVRDVEKEEEEYVNDCGDDEEDRISRFRLRKRFEQAQLAATVKQQLQQQQLLQSTAATITTTTTTTTTTNSVKGVESESVNGDSVKNSLFAVYRTFFSLAAFEKEDKRNVSSAASQQQQSPSSTLSINYRNAELADKQLAALILERPQKQPDEFAALTRLFMDLSGNYGGILTSKALQHCLKYLTGLNELSINFSNQFLWMDFMYFGRTLQTYQTNLRSLHLNLKDTKIETTHLVDFVQSVNTMDHLEQLVLDISKNTFQLVDETYFVGMKYRNLRVPQVVVHLNDVELELDSMQSVMNVVVKQNSKLVSLLVSSNSDINKFSLNNFVSYLLKKPSLNELLFRVNLTDMKRKRFSDMIAHCAGASSLKQLGFILTGKNIGSSVDDLGLLTTACSNLQRFFVDVTEIRDSDAESVTRFIQQLNETAKTSKIHFTIQLKNCDNHLKVKNTLTGLSDNIELVF